MFIFNLFISEYLYHILPCSMEGDEGDIFSNAPDWKALFLLKAEIKQNPGFPSKEYNSIFELICQNIRAYPRRKKNLHWSMIRKILLHIGRNPNKARCRQTSVACSKYIWKGMWGSVPTQENFTIFTLIFQLRNSFPST